MQSMTRTSVRCNGGADTTSGNGVHHHQILARGQDLSQTVCCQAVPTVTLVRCTRWIDPISYTCKTLDPTSKKRTWLASGPG